MMRILIADNDEKTLVSLSEALTAQQYETVRAKDGIEVLALAGREQFNGIIMDVLLPGMDGLSVLHVLRKQGDPVPVMLLTGLSGISDRIAGLDAGADAYMTKPYDLPEVLARVRAMVRRPALASGTVQTGNILLDEGTRTLSSPTGTLSLSRLEFGLMELMMRNADVFFTGDTLLDRVWGMDSKAGTDSVYVYMSALRKKLEKLGADIRIKSKRGIGYALVRIKGHPDHADT